MCEMASSRPETTRTASSSASYSVAQSASVAGAYSRPSSSPRFSAMEVVLWSPWTSTPQSLHAATSLGRNSEATASSTRTVSMALHTPGRWTLAFSMMRSAMSRSAAACTYTWQLPSPVWMTGTLDCSMHVRMSEWPPRGMMRSTSPSARMSSIVCSWPSDTSREAQSAGRPASEMPRLHASTMAAQDSSAAEPPRNTTALPVRSVRQMASAVTLGRAS